MALVLSQIIPPLNNIQNVIERFYLKYGNIDRIEIVKNPRPNHPTVNEIDNFLFEIGRNIVTYRKQKYYIKKVGENKKKRVTTIQTLFTIMILIVWVFLIIVIWIYYVNQYKEYKKKWIPEKPQVLQAGAEIPASGADGSGPPAASPAAGAAEAAGPPAAGPQAEAAGPQAVETGPEAAKTEAPPVPEAGTPAAPEAGAGEPKPETELEKHTRGGYGGLTVLALIKAIIVTAVITYCTVMSISILSEWADMLKDFYKKQYEDSLDHVEEESNLSEILDTIKFDIEKEESSELAKTGYKYIIKNDIDNLSQVFLVYMKHKPNTIFYSGDGKCVIGKCNGDEEVRKDIKNEFDNSISKKPSETKEDTSVTTLKLNLLPYKIKEDIQSIDYYGRYKVLNRNMEELRKFLMSSQDKEFQKQSSGEQIQEALVKVIPYELYGKYRILDKTYVVPLDYNDSEKDFKSIFDTSVTNFTNQPSEDNLDKLLMKLVPKYLASETIDESNLYNFKFNANNIGAKIYNLLKATNVSGFHIFTVTNASVSDVEYVIIPTTHVNEGATNNTASGDDPNDTTISYDSSKTKLIYSSNNREEYRDYIEKINEVFSRSLFFAKTQITEELKKNGISPERNLSESKARVLGMVYESGNRHFSDIISNNILSKDLHMSYELSRANINEYHEALANIIGTNYDIHIKEKIETLFNNATHVMKVNNHSKSKNNLDRFITKERFIQKIGEKSSEDFMINFVYRLFVVYQSIYKIDSLTQEIGGTLQQSKRDSHELKETVFFAIFITLLLVFVQMFVGGTQKSIKSLIENQFFFNDPCANKQTQDEKNDQVSTPDIFESFKNIMQGFRKCNNPIIQRADEAFSKEENKNDSPFVDVLKKTGNVLTGAVVKTGEGIDKVIETAEDSVVGRFFNSMRGWQTLETIFKQFFIVFLIQGVLWIIYYLLKNIELKSHKKYLYNVNVLDTNTYNIKRDSKAILRFLLGDMYDNVNNLLINQYGTLETSSLTSDVLINKIRKLQTHDIDFDYWKITKIATGSDLKTELSIEDPSNSMLIFQLLALYNRMDTDDNITVSDNNNLGFIYDRLVKTVVSYEKCTNITELARSKVIFPWTTLFVYTVVLIILGAALFLIISEYNLIEHTQDLILMREIEKIRSEQGDKEVSEEDEELIKCHYERNKEIHKMVTKKKSVIYLLGIVFVIMIAILAVAAFESDTESYTVNLYTSDEFYDNQCVDY